MLESAGDRPEEFRNAVIKFQSGLNHYFAIFVQTNEEKYRARLRLPKEVVSALKLPLEYSLVKSLPPLEHFEALKHSIFECFLKKKSLAAWQQWLGQYLDALGEDKGESKQFIAEVLEEINNRLKG